MWGQLQKNPSEGRDEEEEGEEDVHDDDLEEEHLTPNGLNAVLCFYLRAARGVVLVVALVVCLAIGIGYGVISRVREPSRSQVALAVSELAALPLQPTSAPEASATTAKRADAKTGSACSKCVFMDSSTGARVFSSGRLRTIDPFFGSRCYTLAEAEALLATRNGLWPSFAGAEVALLPPAMKAHPTGCYSLPTGVACHAANKGEACPST